MAAPDKPNIILVLADQLRADALGCYGNSIVKTPNLDRLAAGGTLFGDAMVTQPTCTPSRASMLTGCYPSTVRTRMVGCETPDDSRFAPRVLRQEGYHTASIGKIHLNPQGAEPGYIEATRDADGTFDYYGFTEVELVNGHGARCFGPSYSKRLAQVHPDHQERYERRTFYPEGLEGAKAGTHEWPYDAELHSSHFIADRAIEFLRRSHEEPFFLHLSFPDPHHPFTVPEPWASMYALDDMPPPIDRAESGTMPAWYEAVYNGAGSERVVDGTYNDPIAGTPPYEYSKVAQRDWARVKSLYYGMISYLDDQLGRVLEELERSALADDTIVVFTADHGDYLGDHGFVGKGYHFDGALRVPLIASGPNLAVGQRCRQPASILDIAPTLYELAGIDEPVGVQGVSQAQYLRGRADYRRHTALTENDDDFAGEKLRTLVTHDWKITYYTGRDGGELYHRPSDPQERHNLWWDPEHRTTRDALERALLEEVVCGLDIVPPRPQKPAPIPKKWMPRAWLGAAPLETFGRRS
jgi:arylsulfatase A-like enzyme